VIYREINRCLYFPHNFILKMVRRALILSSKLRDDLRLRIASVSAW